jgi:hypothetical protein
MNDNVIALPTHAGSSKASVINPSANSKRPRPIVRAVDADGEELAWDPEVREQYTFVDGEAVRAGDSFAIVRPGMERWPLGHASDVYKCASHRGTVKMITEACSETVEPFQKALMSGHGYRIAHQFHVVREKEATLHDLKVTSRMTVVHDHTALHALKACMVVYVGKDAIGSLINARAIHVANNPEKWRVAVENMVERSNKAQEAILALIKAKDANAGFATDFIDVLHPPRNPDDGAHRAKGVGRLRELAGLLDPDRRRRGGHAELPRACPEASLRARRKCRQRGGRDRPDVQAAL